MFLVRGLLGGDKKISSCRQHEAPMPHSVTNKLAGSSCREIENPHYLVNDTANTVMLTK